MVFIVPRALKKGRLFFNNYRLLDLIILGVSTVIAGISLVTIALRGNSVISMIVTIFFLCFIPIGVGYILVLPLPNYHNVLEWIVTFIYYKKKTKHYLYDGGERFDE